MSQVKTSLLNGFMNDSYAGKPLCARAPTRIDFAGGWTDLIPFASQTEGAVLNAAINLYVYASLTPRAGDAVSLYSADLQRQFGMPSTSTPLRGLSLPEAVLSCVRPKRGCHLTTRSQAPKGGGLGASGALGVALVSVLYAFAGELAADPIVDIANGIERETGIPCGKQDHYASLWGGFNFLQFQGESVIATPLHLKSDIIWQLQKSLLLVYTGESHFSGEILQNVVDAYQEGNRSTRNALAALRRIAREMKSALCEGDLSSFGQLISENWSYQKQLHPSVTTARIENLFEIAQRNGCTGGKVCGAGGGGCLAFYCPEDRESPVANALTAAGAPPIHFCFDFDGLSIWMPMEYRL